MWTGMNEMCSLSLTDVVESGGGEEESFLSDVCMCVCLRMMRRQSVRLLVAVLCLHLLGEATGAQTPDVLVVPNGTNASLRVVPQNADNSAVRKLVLVGNQISLNGTDRLNLASYPELEDLVLDGNLVAHIPAHYFSVVPNLRLLSLAHNHLISLDSNAFSGLEVLTSLDLSYNLLTSLPAQLTTDLNQLRMLNLSGNPWNCSCPLLSMTHINPAHITAEGSRLLCASPPDQAGGEVLQAAALCSSPPGPSTQTQSWAAVDSQQSSTLTTTSPSLSNNHSLVNEQKPVLGNTWKFTVCVAALAAATSLLIVCAVKGPSWYKLFHNYRHRRLQQDYDDEADFVSNVFSNTRNHQQTFSFQHKRQQTEEEEEEEEEQEEDGYFEDPYIRTGEDILTEP